jgi:hypothetical protein
VQAVFQSNRNNKSQIAGDLPNMSVSCLKLAKMKDTDNKAEIVLVVG